MGPCRPGAGAGGPARHPPQRARLPRRASRTSPVAPPSGQGPGQAPCPRGVLPPHGVLPRRGSCPRREVQIRSLSRTVRLASTTTPGPPLPRRPATAFVPVPPPGSSRRRRPPQRPSTVDRARLMTRSRGASRLRVLASTPIPRTVRSPLPRCTTSPSSVTAPARARTGAPAWSPGPCPRTRPPPRTARRRRRRRTSTRRVGRDALGPRAPLRACPCPCRTSTPTASTPPRRGSLHQGCGDDEGVQVRRPAPLRCDAVRQWAKLPR